MVTLGGAESSPKAAPAAAAPGAQPGGATPPGERPVRRFVARPRAAVATPATPTAPAPSAPVATPPAAPSAPAPAESGLAERLARIEAQQRAQVNETAFGDLAAATTLKPIYREIVRGLVETHVGSDANLADPKVRQKAAAYIDTLPQKYPDMFGPKAQRQESQSEWAARLAASRTKGEVPKSSIAGQMNAEQLQRMLSGRRD